MDARLLKPIAPYVGQVVGYVETSHERRNMCVISGLWFAVATEPRQEELAKGEIGSAGLVVYWPKLPREERHGRGRMRHVFRSMFPSIIFVKCEPHPDHWGHVRGCRGVHRLLGHCSPLAIPEGALEVVRLREFEEAQKEAERAHREEVAKIARDKGKSGIIWDFAPEEVVRIKHGPFAGFNAQLEDAVDDHDRIKALVSLFGRQSAIELSAFDIDKL